MPNYRRPNISGGTYFITQVTYQRETWLCREVGRKALREAIEKVREKYPFSIDAFVLLPEHFHCLWALPLVNLFFPSAFCLLPSFLQSVSIQPDMILKGHVAI
ncbi:MULTISPECIES: transposase [unclassified Okeania]|uniref:transposase n=1 Tax=unclassified Okeania TaxID=2634635 RepID=UPI00257BAF5B|nr:MULTISPECIES: transposase [unclassified Okeania]